MVRARQLRRTATHTSLLGEVDLITRLASTECLYSWARAAVSKGSLRVVKRRRLIQDQVRLHDDQIAELLGLYRDGSSVRELAARFGINRKTVSIHLERHGVPRRVVQAKLSADDIERAAELYRSGLSLVSVGEDLGVNAKTVSKALHRVGVTMRPRQGGLPAPTTAATKATSASSGD